MPQTFVMWKFRTFFRPLILLIKKVALGALGDHIYHALDPIAQVGPTFKVQTLSEVSVDSRTDRCFALLLSEGKEIFPEKLKHRDLNQNYGSRSEFHRAVLFRCRRLFIDYLSLEIPGLSFQVDLSF